MGIFHCYVSLSESNFHLRILNLLQGMAWTELKFPREEDEMTGMGWSKGPSGVAASYGRCQYVANENHKMPG